MTGKRKGYSADFKAKVALEALRGELTTAQLASKHGMHQPDPKSKKAQAVYNRMMAARSGRGHADIYPQSLALGVAEAERNGSCGLIVPSQSTAQLVHSYCFCYSGPESAFSTRWCGRCWLIGRRVLAGLGLQTEPREFFIYTSWNGSVVSTFDTF